MEIIWANRLVAGTKTWAQVPNVRKDGVRAVLAKRVEAGIITAEMYESITGDAIDA